MPRPTAIADIEPPLAPREREHADERRASACQREAFEADGSASRQPRLRPRRAIFRRVSPQTSPMLLTISISLLAGLMNSASASHRRIYAPASVLSTTAPRR